MKKSWKKSITWNVIAYIITLTVSWIITRRVDISLSIGVVERGLKLIVYPLHERFWEAR